MRYREFAPSTPLAPYVERLWLLEGEAHEIGVEPIPPDGHAEIIVHAGAPFAETRPDATICVQDRVLLAGQATRSSRVAPTGFARIAGARLRPYGAYALFGVPQDQLRNQIASLTDVDAGLARRLRGDVAALESGAAMIAALDRALAVRAHTAAPPSSLAAAVALALDRRGLVRVDALARRAGLGARQLERRFREEVGLPPKLFLRITRFQEVLRALRFGADAATWADVAAAHGFYDQPHFIRDFKSFVGESPAAWNVGDESLAAIFSAIRRGAVSNPGSDRGGHGGHGAHGGRR